MRLSTTSVFLSIGIICAGGCGKVKSLAPDGAMNAVDSSPSVADAPVADAPGADGPGADAADPLGCAGQPAPTTADQQVTLAEQVNYNGGTLSGVTVKAIENSTGNLLTQGVTDSSGKLTLMFNTGGAPIDLRLDDSLSGYLTCHTYDDVPITTSRTGAIGIMTAMDRAGLYGSVTPDTTAGTAILFVLDCNAQPVAGATVDVTPAPAFIAYDGGNATGRYAQVVLGNVVAGKTRVVVHAGSVTYPAYTFEVGGNEVAFVYLRPSPALLWGY